MRNDDDTLVVLLEDDVDISSLADQHSDAVKMILRGDRWTVSAVLSTTGRVYTLPKVYAKTSVEARNQFISIMRNIRRTDSPWEAFKVIKG